MSNILLHVGFQKTGTTSIQYWLRDHERVLAEHEMRFPRAWLHLNTHVELSLTLTRLSRMTQGRMRGDEWRDPNWRASVHKQVRDDLAAHPNELTILSNEDLSLLRYDDEIVRVRELLGDAVIVAYLREPSEFVASLAAHYSKPTMAGLSDDPDAFNHVTPDSWLCRYEERIALWRRHFSRVRTLDYDAATARDGSVIPSFLRLLHVPVTTDAGLYRMQRRSDPVPRLPGNRHYGLRFGEPLIDGYHSHEGGKLPPRSSMPVN